VVGLFKAAFHEVSQLAMDGSGTGRTLDDDAVEDVTRMISRAAAANLRDIERSLTFLATTAATARSSACSARCGGSWTLFTRSAVGRDEHPELRPRDRRGADRDRGRARAAVPAAVGYNYFLRQVRIMSIEMEEFEYDFIHLLQKRRRRPV